MTALETFGTFVAQGVRGSVTRDLRRAIRLHALDTVAAWIGGSDTAEARQIITTAEAVSDESDGALRDIMLNCARVRLSEVDDIHIGAMITPGSFVVPAALSIAARLPQANGQNAQTLNEAILCGYEAMVRLGLALDGPSILYRGIWPSYIAAPFGVAAVASRLLDLTPAQAAHALALALTQAAPGVGGVGGPSTARWIAAGSNARQGLVAARAARAGYTSDLGLLDGQFFKYIYSLSPNANALTDGLGERSVISDVSFKPWCAARQTMAPTQALREIVDGGVAVSSIMSIEVAVPPPFLRMIDHGIVETDRMARLTSVQYQMASAVLDPDSGIDVGQTRKVPPDVLALMEKIKVVADDTLLQDFPRTWRSRVVAHGPGARHERLVMHVPGDPQRPFSKRDIATKFHGLADAMIGAAAVDGLIGLTGRVLDGSAAPAQLLADIGRATGR
jgi:2-methylcitrate dehydratase PrpD